ncbi:MAG: hypothetical protein ACOCRL_01860 [Bacillota bacterium]
MKKSIYLIIVIILVTIFLLTGCSKDLMNSNENKRTDIVIKTVDNNGNTIDADSIILLKKIRIVKLIFKRM